MKICTGACKKCSENQSRSVAGGDRLRGRKYEVVLIDEPLSLTDVDNIETWCRGKLVGYVIE